MAKELDALKRSGYSNTLLCWDRFCREDSLPQSDEYDQIIFRMKAPIGTWILFFLPVWWCFVFIKLMSTQWDVVHAINFDTLIPALAAAKLKRKVVVYEIFDVYADVRVLPGIVRKIGINTEKLFLRLADGVILANEGQPEEMNGVPNRNVVSIFNTPPDACKDVKSQNHTPFTIFFAGALDSARQTNVEKVCQAVLQIEGVKIVIAGYGDTVESFQKLAAADPEKVVFLGTIPYSEVLKRTLESDLTFALYHPSVPTTRYAGCNKLFEAMMAGKPLLVGKGTTMADIVRRENSGLVIDSSSVDEIRDAIIQLKEDPAKRFQIGANGRKAYEEKYNWKLMEKRLLAFYDQLFL